MDQSHPIIDWPDGYVFFRREHGGDTEIRGTPIMGVDGKEAHLLSADEGGNLQISLGELGNVLSCMLNELRKINLHLELLTEARLTNQDVEE